MDEINYVVFSVITSYYQKSSVIKLICVVWMDLYTNVSGDFKKREFIMVLERDVCVFGPHICHMYIDGDTA